MPIEVLMPALSPTMETGTLAKWMVKEGDTVAPGDIIAEIETDKATMEVEAVDEGTVGKLLIDEGTENVPVNELIALLLAEGEDKSALEGAGKKADSKPAEAKDEAKQAPKEEKADKPAEPARAETPARKDAPAPKTNGKDGDRLFASPLARRIAEQKGLDLAAISGSGPRGRIVQRDVEEAKPQPAAKGGAKAPAAPAPGAMPDDQVKAFFEDGTYEELPHDGMRKTIARRLVQSKLTIPHYYLTVECELDALMALRRDLNDAAPRNKEGDATYRLSVNDFLIRAMALALQKVPMANATWTESARLLHKHSDVGVAVALPDGLITPLIRRAEQKTLSVISGEIKDLAARARDKKLKPHEYEGGTTAVSNLGMYGIRDFTAVINPPHATILAVGQSEEKAVVKKGRIVTATMMTVTLSCDHRVVDGALGAQLLSAFKSYVEKPLTMLA